MSIVIFPSRYSQSLLFILLPVFIIHLSLSSSFFLVLFSCSFLLILLVLSFCSLFSSFLLVLFLLFCTGPLPSIVRMHLSLIRLFRTARFARTLTCASLSSLAHSLTHSLLSSWERGFFYEMNASFSYSFTHCTPPPPPAMLLGEWPTTVKYGH